MNIDPVTATIGAEISGIDLSQPLQYTRSIRTCPAMTGSLFCRMMVTGRTTQHFAVADFLPDYRRMRRVIIDTDRRAPAWETFRLFEYVKYALSHHGQYE